MSRQKLTTAVLALSLAALPGAIGWRILHATSTAADDKKLDPARVERGAHLVRTMGCNDCHTPWKVGPKGPEPDMTRALTGHPSDFVVNTAPTLPEPWTWAAAATNTAFAGPWGISYAMNLTPDKETGLGEWTEEMFIATMRTGRHQGKGRAIKPPMPYFIIGNLNDEDVKSLFAYLQSLKPVRNRIPNTIDPPER
jgi:hypothetical protein